MSLEPADRNVRATPKPIRVHGRAFAVFLLLVLSALGESVQRQLVFPTTLSIRPDRRFVIAYPAPPPLNPPSFGRERILKGSERVLTFDTFGVLF